MAIAVSGEIRSMPEWLDGAYLHDNGLVAVAIAEPYRETYPGVQSRVHIDDSGPRLDHTGLVVGTADLRLAAAFARQQFAYRNGWPPGHGGTQFTAGGSEVEPLASDELKQSLRAAADQGYIGYLALVDGTGLEPAVPANFGAGSTATRQTRSSRFLFGISVRDLGALLGAGGFDALRDGADHPIVAPRMQAFGLRPERFGSSG